MYNCAVPMRRLWCTAAALLIGCLGLGGDERQPRRFAVGAGRLYGLTVSASPDRLPAGEILVTVRDGRGALVEKALHPFDLDLYATVRPRTDGYLTVETAAKGAGLDDEGLEIDLAGVSSASPAAVIAVSPNGGWREAQQFDLGQTIFGSGDHRPYVPASSEGAYDGLTAGVEWFRFTSHASRPQLVYFALDVTHRDVPADVDIFQRDGDELRPHRVGASAYTPEATQNFPGLLKFRTAIVEPGQTYYVRVAANHPAWRLRTELHDVPPYHEAAQAVIAGMNYLVRLGEAWHANMPRRGAVALRNTMPHAEAQSCIACHPTQFTARAYLTAVKNGYPAANRPAIDFLLERLRNNPRPLYGQPGTDWARVIFSARTVASRVPVLLELGYEVLDGPPSSEVTHAYANYLNLHWAGLTQLPDAEADGALPAVSPFEIALQSWQTYALAARDFPGEGQWPERQAAVEHLAAAAQPANLIDVAWKIAALATFDRTRYGARIASLIDELYRWQRDDGRLPYTLDAAAPASDFITYHAMYALAVAGRRPEGDPRLAKMVVYALRAQRPEGSWQGSPAYKGFDTPFRDTQFAVMGLSELFPYRGSKPRQPADLEMLAGVEPAASVLSGSQPVLAREAAARVCQDIQALAHALGDRSKLVQLAAAESLRRQASRDGAAAPRILAALQSPDTRTRWGALRVFDSHFRDLSGDQKLLDAVLRALSDRAPANRFAAAKALWQWYSWQSDSPPMRSRILDALAGRMGEETDAAVSRGLSESVYNILDENVGQLAAWQRAMSGEPDRRRTEEALHAVVREQSAIVARRLRESNRSGRMSLLTALWDFHSRHMAIPEDNRGKVDVILPAFRSEYAGGVERLGQKDFEYAPYREAAAFRYDARNGFQVVRLGNDSDLIHLFADSGTELEQALIACLAGADGQMALEVIKAGSVLGEAATLRFTAAMLELLENKDAELRAAVRYVYENHARGRLSLGEGGELAPLLARLLVPGRPDALAVALPLIAELAPTHPLVHDPVLTARIEALARDASLPSYPEVLRAAAAFPWVADGPLMRAQLLEALASGDERASAAAVRLAVGHYVTDPTLSALSRQFLHATRGPVRTILLDELDPNRYALRLTAASAYNPGRLFAVPLDGNLLSMPEVVEIVAESLRDQSAAVREAARDLVAEHKELAGNPAIPKIAEPRLAPDYEFFRARVEPILNRPGADGKACVMCHASHAIFKLLPQHTRENYRSALKVIDTLEPRKSLLLIKPTRPNDSSGDANLYLATHNGGERWAASEASPEYRTILEWIRGARLP